MGAKIPFISENHSNYLVLLFGVHPFVMLCREETSQFLSDLTSLVWKSYFISHKI